MPIYDYKCLKCGNTFEVLIIDKHKKIKCLKCESDNLQKIPSTFQAVYKGTGFYSTDYKKVDGDGKKI